MDLTQYSTPELKDILNRLPKEIAQREKVEKAQLRKELEAKAAAAGFTLEELIRFSRNRTTAVEAKYRHPTNPKQVWVGRGPRPRWMIEFLGAGGTLAQLEA